MCEAKKRTKYDSHFKSYAAKLPRPPPSAHPHTQFQFSCLVICLDNLYARQAYIEDARTLTPSWRYCSWCEMK